MVGPRRVRKRVSRQRNSKGGSTPSISRSQVLAIQKERSKQAQRTDAALKATLARDRDQWAKYPSRYDLPDVDLGKIKRISKPKGKLAKAGSHTKWRLRDLDKMTIAELEDYDEKLRKVATWRSRPYDERIRVEKEKVEMLLHKKRSAEQERILNMAQAGTLTFSNTPDKNPYPYMYSTYDSRGRRRDCNDNTAHNLISPFVEAKERTKGVVEVMESYGYDRAGLSTDSIFKDYVAYYQREYGERGKDPYLKVWEISIRADDLQPQVKNVVESKAFENGTGEVSVRAVTNEFKLDDQLAVKAAISNMAKEEGWRQSGSTIRISRGKPVVKPNMAAIILLKDLDVLGVPLDPDLSSASSEPDVLAKVENGNADLRFMNRDRTVAFYGTMDVSGIPGLKSAKGEKIIKLQGGSTAALNRPDVAYVTPTGELVLKKHNVMQTRTEYAEGDYLREKPKKVKTKVTREFSISIKDPTPVDKSSRYVIPKPKIQYTNAFEVDVKKLRDLVKTMKVDDVKDYGYTETVKFYAKKGRVFVVRRAEREDWTSDYEDKRKYKRHIAVEGKLLRSDENATAVYGIEYLQQLVKAAGKQKTILIEFSRDMPLKAKLDNEAIKGDWLLAPRIEND